MQSTHEDEDSGLSSKGEKQYNDLSDQFIDNAQYITNILFSPVHRAAETAWKKCGYVARRGVDIELMPGLSGRLDDKLWMVLTRSSYGKIFLVHEPFPRDANFKHAQDTWKWLTLRRLAPQEAQEYAKWSLRTECF